MVEPDEDTLLAADYIVDIGPGAGEHGGQVVATGTARELMENPASVTGAYLSGRLQIPVPETRRTPTQLAQSAASCRNEEACISILMRSGHPNSL